MIMSDNARVRSLYLALSPVSFFRFSVQQTRLVPLQKIKLSVAVIS